MAHLVAASQLSFEPLNRMHELIPGAGLSGSVFLDGKISTVKKLTQLLCVLRVGMVFQKPNPFPTMSIKENVISGLKLSGRKIEDQLHDLVETSLKRASMWNEVKDRLGRACAFSFRWAAAAPLYRRSLAMNPEVLC